MNAKKGSGQQWLYLFSLNLRTMSVFFGIHLLVCALFHQDRVLLSFVETSISGIAFIVTFYSPQKRRNIIFLMLTAGIILIEWLLHKANSILLFGISAALSLLQVLLSVRIRKKEAESAVTTLGFCLFPVILFLYQRIAQNDAGSTAIVTAFIVFSFLTLFRINKNILLEGSADSSELPLRVSRQNRVYIILFSLVVLLIANIGWVRDRLYDIWHLMKKGFAWIVNVILSLFPQPEDTAAGSVGPGQMMDLGGAESGEPSWLAVALEKIVTYFSLLVLLVLLIWGIKKAVQFLPVLLRRINKLLQRFNDELSKDYTDEIINTRENNKYKRVRHTLGTKRRKRKLDHSSPNAYVRSVYGRMMDQHQEWEMNSTARENLRSELAEVYEKARYSSYDLTQDEADRFSELQT